jgi:RHS repeat-associated protein
LFSDLALFVLLIFSLILSNFLPHSSSITDNYKTDAYGVELATSGVTSNAYRFAGEQFDDDLQAYFLRARYLDAKHGRFLSVDGFEGFNADPLSLHKYLYCNSSPVDSSDPSGNLTIAEAGAVFASLGILAGITAHFNGAYLKQSILVGVTAGATGVAVGSGLGVLAASTVTVGGLVISGKVLALAIGGALAIGSTYHFATEVFDTNKSDEVRLWSGVMALISIGLIVAAPETEAPKAQVQVNRTSGKAEEVTFVSDLIKIGINVVGEQIAVKTPFGYRIADVVVKVGDQFYGIEVKSGGATASSSQVAKDNYINGAGGVQTGPKGQKLGIPEIQSMTTVYR